MLIALGDALILAVTLGLAVAAVLGLIRFLRWALENRTRR